MTAPSVIYLLRWLVRDTFRQALASRIFWIMLAVSVLATIFCLGVGIEGGGDIRPDKDYLYAPGTAKPLDRPGPELGRLSLLYGAFRVQLFRDARAAIELLYVILGTWVAGAAGLLLALVFTAGFLPEALQPNSAAVLFAKPAPRWLYVVGKYLGVVVFVAVQAALFFVATWLALGFRTGIWQVGYLAGVPILTLHFAAIYAFSVLLAVCTRNTVACVLGSVLFWIVCMAMNYARNSTLALPQLAPKEQTSLSPVSVALVETGYWVMPKPADMIVLLEDSLQAQKHKTTLSNLPEFRAVREQGKFDPVLILLSTAGFIIFILAVAGLQIGKVDY